MYLFKVGADNSSLFPSGIIAGTKVQTPLATWPLSKAKATVRIPVGPRNSGLGAVIKTESTPGCINKLVIPFSPTVVLGVATGQNCASCFDAAMSDTRSLCRKLNL